MVIKILLIGDEKVGKSTIKNSYLRINPSDSMTQGLSYADIRTKDFDGPGTENKNIKLQLWDVDSNFEKIILVDTNIFTGVHAIVLVYDVTNIHSLNYVRRNHPKIMNLLNNKNIPVILVGTKIDLRNEFEVGAMHVSYETGMDVANQLSLKGVVSLRIPYFEISKEIPDSVDMIFQFITTKLLGMFT